MIRKFTFLLLFIFNPVHALEIKTSYQLEKHIESFSKDDLMQTLRDFIEASKPGRFVGSVGHKNAQNFLIKKIKTFDPKEKGQLVIDDFKLNTEKQKEMYQKDFDTKIKATMDENSSEYKKWKGFTDYALAMIESLKDNKGKNIIWKKKGSDDEAQTIVLTAHYDTVVLDPTNLKVDLKANMPGADYNASGVSILLGLIKTLAPLNMKKNIEVVFLDYQSLGLAGSLDLAEKLKERDDVIGVINLEMLGNDSTFFDKQKQNGNMKMYTRTLKSDPEKEDQKLVKILKENSKNFSAGIRFTPFANDFQGSDNIRFWEQGIASVTLSQDWENDFNDKRYQTSNDFPETLNQTTFHRAYLYITGSMATFLEVL